MEHTLVRHLDLIAEAGSGLPLHAHSWGQLLLVAGGAVSIETGSGQWLIAPGRSVWVPPRAQHVLVIHKRATLRFMYVSPDHCRELPTQSRLIRVSALLRELMKEIIGRAPLDTHVESVHLCDLLVDQTRACAIENVELLMPVDSRARTVALRIQQPNHLADTLDQLIAGCGASRRTIERHFLEETGTSLAIWRQRWRMNVAAEKLLSGMSVVAVAQLLGYRSVASLRTSFCEQHGVTPARFIG